MPVQDIHADILQQAQQHQNTLTKPAGSLGKLEDIACWFAVRQNKVIPKMLRPHITVFAADHGVTAEGISAFPSVVTGEMVKNLAKGGAAINVLAQQISASLNVVDVGVLIDTSHIQAVQQSKTQSSTTNILHQPAMSQEACEAAVNEGEKAARHAIQNGANILIAGDMGIGNTTASAVLICMFTGAAPERIVGKGTGINNDVHAHKVNVVKQIIQRINANNIKPEDYLQQGGGFEIAAMAGFYLEAATLGVPIIIDGFISSAAALVAHAHESGVTQWMMASHLSQESGHGEALAYLGLNPLLDFQLRLGEGSGAALVVPLLQSAIALHQNMATFESAQVTDKKI